MASAATGLGRCLACGRLAPTRQAELNQNVGLLVVRLTQRVQGQLCRDCIESNFWRMSLVTAAAGWLGVISFFVTPIVLLRNFFQLLAARSLGRVLPAGDGQDRPETVRILPPPRDGLALAAMIVGLTTLPLCGLLGLGSLAAIALGGVALLQARRDPLQYGGRGMAWAGMASGAASLALAGLVGLLAVLPSFIPHHETGTGERELQAAERAILTYRGRAGDGNTAEAAQMAERFSATMEAMRKVAFTGDDSQHVSLSEGHFLTWVELREDSACFLVHVPGLRRYEARARQALLDLAWATARAALPREGGAGPSRLAIGLRGTLFYGAAAVGAPGSDPVRHLDGPVPTRLFVPFFTGSVGSRRTPPPEAEPAAPRP